MSDWTTALLAGDQPFGVLSTIGPGSPAADVGVNVGLLLAGAPWPSANVAIYVPVIVQQTVTVPALAWSNGVTASGNVDAGIYDRNGNRLVHTGSTAQAGTSTAQVVSVASTVLTPDLYYMAMAMDNTTGTVSRLALGGVLAESCGVAQQATAFPLPATAAFATMAQAFMPVIVGQIASVF